MSIDKSEMKTELEKVKSGSYKFPWGRVLQVYEISEYGIVEYNPRKVVGCTLTDALDMDKKEYSCYIDGKSISMSANSLDAALLICISYKHDGVNTRAPEYMIRMLGIK